MTNLIFVLRPDDTGATIATARRMNNFLLQRFGKKILIRYIEANPPGIDFKQYIEDTIKEAFVELVVIGPHWLDSRNEQGQRRLDDPEDLVRQEIEAALAFGTPIIPVLVDQASMPGEDKLPESLKKSYASKPWRFVPILISILI